MSQLRFSKLESLWFSSYELKDLYRKFKQLERYLECCGCLLVYQTFNVFYLTWAFSFPSALLDWIFFP